MEGVNTKPWRTRRLCRGAHQLEGDNLLELAVVARRTIDGAHPSLAQNGFDSIAPNPRSHEPFIGPRRQRVPHRFASFVMFQERAHLLLHGFILDPIEEPGTLRRRASQRRREKPPDIVPLFLP